MDVVKVEISPGLTGTESMTSTIFEIELREMVTVNGVLQQLAERYEVFRTVAFDADSQKFNGLIFIVLNGRLLQTPQELETRLQNGDNLILSPPYTGG